MSDTTSRYTANIKVERVVNPPKTSERRQVAESLNITVRAQSLSTLKEKIAGHVALLDEEDIS